MEISETGSSIGNTSNTRGFEVFLSFRGPDTRRGFTSMLYHFLMEVGIRVFIDDEGLRMGETIGDEVVRAIDDSKLYIPIISPTYASSSWCLSELAKMMENTFKSTDEDKKVILPIFYDVNPDDVQLKTNLYENAILKLQRQMEDQKKFRTDKVETWRRALRQVGRTKGLERKNYSSDVDLCKAVAREVVLLLQTKQKISKNLIGMEVPIAAIYSILDIDSTDVRLIGIYGMGGVGKTALAREIFNRLCHRFEFCSFLTDVRETEKTMGLVKLQEQLLIDICKSRLAHNIANIDHGIMAIESILRNKKVLIVLDDVDDNRQIQKTIGMNLCPGSRILITTRNRDILKIEGFRGDIISFEMEPLRDKDALQLFSRYAFNDDSPPTDYHALSVHIVEAIGGIPSALTVIGSYLFNRKEIEIWKDTLQSLSATGDEDPLTKQMISYDKLDIQQQQIFLDIACFFSGHSKIGPISFWKDCGFSPEFALEVLTRMSMINISEDNIIWMQNDSRDLGRKIAKEQHTRLLDREDIIHQLKSRKIKESVQALHLEAEFGSPITITVQEINERFPNLQFLSLSNVICQGDFMSCLSKLKWIDLHYSRKFYTCPEPTHFQGFEATNLPVESLVVVKLSGREFKEEKVRSLIKGARKLEVLTFCCDPPEGGSRDFD